MNKNKHLTLDKRISIQEGLDKGLSFNKIAVTVEKDFTTISKEVRSHLLLVKRKKNHLFSEIKTSTP